VFNGSNLVQLKRFVRLAIVTIITQLPLVVNQEELDWRNLVALIGVPLAEVAYRSLVPATPDVATSPPAARDEAIPPLG
jgi:hypothetical protein